MWCAVSPGWPGPALPCSKRTAEPAQRHGRTARSHRRPRHAEHDESAAPRPPWCCTLGPGATLPAPRPRHPGALVQSGAAAARCQRRLGVGHTHHSAQRCAFLRPLRCPRPGPGTPHSHRTGTALRQPSAGQRALSDAPAVAAARHVHGVCAAGGDMPPLELSVWTRRIPAMAPAQGPVRWSVLRHSLALLWHLALAGIFREAACFYIAQCACALPTVASFTPCGHYLWGACLGGKSVPTWCCPVYGWCLPCRSRAAFAPRHALARRAAARWPCWQQARRCWA